MAEYTLKYTGSEIDEKLDNMATKAYVDSAVSSVMPEFVDSVDQMTDTNKKYVLNETGTIWVYGEVYIEAPNHWDASKVTLNARYSGTPGSEAAGNGYYISDYIPVNLSLADPLTMRLSGDGASDFLTSTMNGKVIFFDSSKAAIATTYWGSESMSAGTANLRHVYTVDGGDYLINIGYTRYNLDTPTKHSVYDNIAYIRLNWHSGASTALTASDVHDMTVTFDAEGGTKSGFYDTGMAWSAGSGSGDTTDLLVQVNNNTAAINELENIVDNLESGSGSVTVPTYWQSAVDGVVSKVKDLQDAGGADVVNFCWFSDLHYVPTSAYTANIGKLCAAVMDECDIPFTLLTGDTTAADTLASENILIDYLKSAADMLSPIGAENLLQIYGNHDDVYGASGSTSYVYKVAPQKIWNAMLREQAKDFRRVYGDHGTYYYVDNVPQKVRFVCLNSHFYDGEAVTSGVTKMMTTGFGTEQLAWLEDVALNAPNDYGVVIALHVPPTASTINGNTHYLSQLSDGTDFRTVISNSTVDIIGIFCGHCHADAIVADDLPCPIVTITSAVNTPYDADWSTRVAGTTTETALDVVSIDKSARKIYCTRLGYGSDRSTSY